MFHHSLREWDYFEAKEGNAGQRQRKEKVLSSRKERLRINTGNESPRNDDEKRGCYLCCSIVSLGQDR